MYNFCKKTVKQIANFVRKNNKKEYRFINVDDNYFKVCEHWFWDEYDQKGWEPQTYQTYFKYLDKDTIYVDVGTWVGLTIIWAAILGCKNIYGIEANPVSYDLATKNFQMNKKTQNVKLSNLCITDKDNEKIHFGHATSSASSIRGGEYEVNTVTLLSYLSNNDLLDKPLFIKIDIEGAEELILSDLEKLINNQDLTLYLSLHPPFIKDKELFAKKLVDILYQFKKVEYSDGKAISKDELYERITTAEEYPEWGTSFGNFFEIIISNVECTKNNIEVF